MVAPEKDFTADVDAILAQGDAEQTKIVFLANPNNPTGTYIPFDEVKRLHAGLPPQCCSCSMRPMPNTCAATTTSPASSWWRPSRKRRDVPHVLEDLRPRRRCASAGSTGRAHVVDAVNRIRGPFNVGAPAIAAGIAAIADAAHVEQARRSTMSAGSRG